MTSKACKFNIPTRLSVIDHISTEYFAEIFSPGYFTINSNKASSWEILRCYISFVVRSLANPWRVTIKKNSFLSFGERHIVRVMHDQLYARIVALNIFADYGVKKHWHRPYIRFGEGTLLSFLDPISENRLSENDVYHFDLGPVWPSQILGIDSNIEFESDYGNTFIRGHNSEGEKMIQALHESFNVAKAKWSQDKLNGVELYSCFQSEVEMRGYKFVDNVDGHRISEFPHHKYTKERLFVPSASLWILEAMIHHPTIRIGAFYEDLIY